MHYDVCESSLLYPNHRSLFVFKRRHREEEEKEAERSIHVIALERSRGSVLGMSFDTNFRMSMGMATTTMMTTMLEEVVALAQKILVERENSHPTLPASGVLENFHLVPVATVHHLSKEAPTPIPRFF